MIIRPIRTPEGGITLNGRAIGCTCHRCIKENNLTVTLGSLVLPLSGVRMIVCPKCGNKRCPKASDHRLPCTSSNEPGQAGSVYAAYVAPQRGQIRELMAADRRPKPAPRVTWWPAVKGLACGVPTVLFFIGYVVFVCWLGGK